jgi:hypothetical protein
MLARQALYHLSHTSSPFIALVIFQVGSFVFAHGWPQTVILLSMAFCVTGITGMSHQVHFID